MERENIERLRLLVAGTFIAACVAAVALLGRGGIEKPAFCGQFLRLRG